MRLTHFEAFRPVCPVCRSQGRGESALDLAQSCREQGRHIVEGVLRCTLPECRSEYPIIDGIPIIVADLRAYVGANVGQIAARADLSETVEGLIGDCCGPGSAFDTDRQIASNYCWDHYAGHDPEESPGEAPPGAAVRALEAGLGLAGDFAAGPAVDLGCAVGGTTFALAQRTGAITLGVDLGFMMLRIAARALREGRVRYPRRRVGLVYERRDFPVPAAGSDRVDFWACDAAALPFAADTFAATVALNVVDCVHSPAVLVDEIARTLAPGGKALVASPYDWSAATPVEAWIGGHSQRGADRGASESRLRTLLAGTGGLADDGALQIIADQPALPWRVRLHDRASVDYVLDLVAVRKPTPPDQEPGVSTT